MKRRNIVGKNAPLYGKHVRPEHELFASTASDDLRRAKRRRSLPLNEGKNVNQNPHEREQRLVFEEKEEGKRTTKTKLGAARAQPWSIEQVLMAGRVVNQGIGRD